MLELKLKIYNILIIVFKKPIFKEFFFLSNIYSRIGSEKRFFNNIFLIEVLRSRECAPNYLIILFRDMLSKCLYKNKSNRFELSFISHLKINYYIIKNILESNIYSDKRYRIYWLRTISLSIQHRPNWNQFFENFIKVKDLYFFSYYWNSFLKRD
jgi:hypothetical protein